MTPTDDERREVAKRLRGLNDNILHVRRVYEAEGISILCDDQADYYQICDMVTGYLPAEHMHPCDYKEVHDRLADLIEPSDTSQSCRDTVACDLRASESVHESGQNQDSVPKESPAVQKAPECDREALLALADKMNRYTSLRKRHGMDVDTMAVMAWVHRIREACGEVGA